MDNIKNKKSLEELTLLDRFLFDEAMENPENMEILLEIILGEEIELKHLPQTEKELRKSSLKRIAKIDVWAMDTKGIVYDAEVQKKNTGNLPKRSRYYQGMMDAMLMKSGIENFNELNKVYIIIIMPFDLFGKGLYKYTFHNTCKEVPDLELGDDAVRIFLNTKGKNDDEVSKELVQLLHFMEYTNDMDDKVSGVRLQRLQENVKNLQQNSEVSVRYMQLWEELLEHRQEGETAGKAIGKAESVLALLEEFGEIPDKLKGKIMAEKDLETLQRWLKKAARAESIEDFVQKMND